MQDERFPKSPEKISLRLASLTSCSMTCGISNSGASLRRTQTLHTTTAHSPRRRRALGTTAETRAGRSASAGSVLMREWHGVAHEVRVLDRGVLYRRKRYRVAH